MKRCPTCLREFKDIVKICPYDGSKLESITEVKSTPLPNISSPSATSQQSSTCTPADFRRGDWLNDRYMIEKLIGQGGFSASYLARDQRLLSKPVVIKFHTGNADGLQKELFRKEIEALARIDHPGAVSIIDFGEHPEGCSYLVMPFIEGVSLRSILTDKGMDFERTANIIQQICQTIDAIHDKGIIHRDLKPENILIQNPGDDQERVKILDFGIARVMNSREPLDSDEGIVIGTPLYMAPEQWQGYTSPSSDIYTIGLLAYEMLTGHRAFQPSSYAGINEVYKLQSEEKLIKPTEFCPDLPYLAQEAILKALAFEPSERYSRAREFGNELARALTDEAFTIASSESQASKPRHIVSSPASPASHQDSMANLQTGDGFVNSTLAPTTFIVAAIGKVLSLGIAEDPLSQEAAESLLYEFQKTLERVRQIHQAHNDIFKIQMAGDDEVAIIYLPKSSLCNCLIETAQQIQQESGNQFRIGLHEGEIYRKEIHSSFEGEAITIAGNIMRCGDQGHILLSEKLAEVTISSSIHMDYLGTREIANGLSITLFNLHSNDIGNPNLPSRFCSSQSLILAPVEENAPSEQTWQANLPAQSESSPWDDFSTGIAFKLDEEVPAPSVRINNRSYTEDDPERTFYPMTNLPYESQTYWNTPLDTSQPLQSGSPQDRIFLPDTLLTSRTGKYRVIRLLDSGRYSDVYQVREEGGFKEDIAAKLLFVDETPDVIRSLLKPWKVISDKYPDQFVRLLGVDTIEAEGGNHKNTKAVAVFTEYMAGQSLLELAKTKWKGYPTTREHLVQLMRLFLQAVRAVSLLHNKRLVHGHIKATNLLLDSTETLCKISEFGLADSSGKIARIFSLHSDTAEPHKKIGIREYSVASDIYELGVVLHNLLSGKFSDNFLKFKMEQALDNQEEYSDLTILNPQISPDLNQVVLRCLSKNPDYRHQSVDDILNDLIHLGVTEEGANAAPINLARLLLTNLDQNDLDYLTRSLEKTGFRSIRASTAQRQADLVEEYCYTSSPHEVLAHNCTSRQLETLARILDIEPGDVMNREEIIEQILKAVGFLPGPKQVFGIETTLIYLQGQLLAVTNAESSDECLGMAHSALTAVERIVNLLMRFYGHLLYSSGVDSFLAKFSNDKPTDRMTIGEKQAALKDICLKRPKLPLPNRIREAFEWPIISRDIFERLEELTRNRNKITHPREFDLDNFYKSQQFAKKILSSCVEVFEKLSKNKHIPNVIQVVSRQDDIYGRYYYLARDEKGHAERIFTPLPLEVGQLYLFYPLTNPVRVNPLLFPFDTTKRKK